MIEQPQRPTNQVDDGREDAIRDRTYAVWCEKGCPEGQDRELWLTAAQEYDARDATVEGGRADEELSAQQSPRT